MTLSKKSVQWHEEGHKNHKKYIQQQIEEIERLQSRLKESQKSYDKKERQINYAKAKNITEFDEDSKIFQRL